MKFHRLVIAICSIGCAGINADEVLLGNLRVQALSDTLIRIEMAGPKGFEGRETFNVINRDWAGSKIDSVEEHDDVVLRMSNCQILIPENPTSLSKIEVQTLDGKPLYIFGDTMPAVDFIPAPAKAKNGVWVMPDAPRIVPPPTGAIPATNPSDTTSGWDLSNDAADVYVFIPGDAGYNQLRKDFLKLTGTTELPPLYTFGYWTSRWFEYTETSALDEIDTFRNKGIPLDLFVVDTDWRVGASHGYGVNTTLFPDMARFLSECRKRNIRTLFNDHPEPVAETALDPKEIAYRADGLKSLLNIGMDAWWYDRNWHTHLREPAPRLRPEVWGMRLYHDITLATRPNQRPLIMSNVDGIDNGKLKRNSLPAAHRFPIWWTGDTTSNWSFLQSGVTNGVNAGTEMLLPFVNEDCGGHIGKPSPELFIRFFQFGTFSPVLRPHTTKGGSRLPWDFGDEAQKILTDYAKLRYRLLPTIYTAAYQAHADGTPMMRRCDLYWPEFNEAADPTQYLFGDDMLVAPIIESRIKTVEIPAECFQTADGKPGLQAEYFPNPKLEGNPLVARIDPTFTFNSGKEAPAPGLPVDLFSARWTGKLTNIPETGEYQLGAIADDGVRIFLNGEKIVESWQGNDSALFTAPVKLDAGKTYDLVVEYLELEQDAKLIASWTKPSDTKPLSSRTLWIPPGEWMNLWTGERFAGPKTVEVAAPLNQLPLFARCGGLVFSIPQIMNTSESLRDKIIVDAFVPSTDGSQTRLLYEDDGSSNAYLSGAASKTAVSLDRHADAVSMKIAGAVGAYAGQTKTRAWTIRLHLPKDTEAQELLIDGKPAAEQQIRSLAPASESPAVLFEGEAKAASDKVIEVLLDAADPKLPHELSLRLK